MKRSLFSACVAATLAIATTAHARDLHGAVRPQTRGPTGFRHEVFAGAATSSLRHGGTPIDRAEDTMGYAAPRVGYGLWGEAKSFAAGGLVSLERGTLEGGLPVWRADLGGGAMLVAGRLRVGLGVAASMLVFERARRASGVAGTQLGPSAFAMLGVDVVQWQGGRALALTVRPDFAQYGGDVSAHRIALTASVRF